VHCAFTAVMLSSCAAGVSCGNDVEVRCTISSVSVSVPERYLLQLFLPFGIQGEAESVKFSSKKQPPTLTVTLAVDSSIPPPAAALSASATAFAQSSSSSSRGSQLQRQQQQRQTSTKFGNSSSCPVSPPADGLQDDLVAVHFLSGPKSTWPRPYAAVADWMDRSGADKAASSILWRLMRCSPPSGDDPADLLPVTIKNVALALLAVLLALVMATSASAYDMVSDGVLQVAAATGRMWERCLLCMDEITGTCRSAVLLWLRCCVSSRRS
jgi:hypothetical protein